MEYTIGNWSVESLTKDSISASKNLAVTDLSYAADFTVAATKDDEVILNNTTGATLEPVEQIRYARTKISDVYSGSDIPAASRIGARNGVRTLCEVKFNLKATNTVSGEEMLLPVKGWMCIQMPTASMITPDAIEYAYGRVFACAMSTGKTDATRVTEVARGDLSPM